MELDTTINTVTYGHILESDDERVMGFTVNSLMPIHSIFKSAEAITFARHVIINPLLLAKSALDSLHFTRYFQRN